MKSYNDLFFEIISPKNLYYAAKEQIRRHNDNPASQRWKDYMIPMVTILYHTLKSGEYVTPEYHVFTIHEPKERIIMSLPFTCRIVHEAMFRVLRPILHQVITRDTFACIKGRGQHLLLRKIKKDLRKDPEGTIYCWKSDVHHYYQEIDQQILLRMMFKLVKCKKTREMLAELVHSVPFGVPIGNQPSQEFGIFYLAYFDHIVKEGFRANYYYRFADDLVIFSDSKAFLQEISYRIRNYLWYQLKLEINDNYQIFKIDERGLDFVGYRFFHDKVILRKRIKVKLCKKVVHLRKRGLTDRQIRLEVASNMGWAKHADVKGLIKRLKIMEDKKKTINADEYSDFTETKVSPEIFNEQAVILHGIRKKKSKFPDRVPAYYYHVKVEHDNKFYVVACYNEGDINLLEAIKEQEAFPIEMKFKRIEHNTEKKKYLIKNV